MTWSFKILKRSFEYGRLGLIQIYLVYEFIYFIIKWKIKCTKKDNIYIYIYIYILQENTKSDLKENWTSNKHQLGQQKSSKG